MDYEKMYASNRKIAKQEAKIWKDRKLKTYKQFKVFRHNVAKDYKATLDFLNVWLPIAWGKRHEDEKIKEDLREALNLTIYLRQLYNNLK